MADQNMIVWEERWKALDRVIEQFRDSLLKRASVSTKAELDTALAAAATPAKIKTRVAPAQPVAAGGAPVTGSAADSNGQDSSSPKPALSLEELQETLNLFNLVDCLKKFGEKQFSFFYDGFVTKADYELNSSREFPATYILSMTLNQIAEDLEVIRRVADQRLSAETGPKLRDADQLAWSALKPALDANLIEDVNTTVMTYFQKSASIRVIPYASVALVAVPFTAPDVPRDYLAIPHEVGHYVYRHGKLEGKSIPQALGKKLMELAEPSSKWARRWKEEIFADLYGCLVGGPVTGLSFRDLALQSSRSQVIQTPGEYLYGQFTEDDGVHPVPILRPYVYTIVLREMIWRKSADSLEKEWRELPQVREATDFRTRYGNSGAEYIDLKVAEAELDKIIKAIFELLPAIKLVRSDWSNDPTGEALAELYQKFEETDGYKDTGFRKLINKREPLKPVPEKTNLWKNWVKKEKFFPGIDDAPPAKGITVIDPGKAQRLEELEQEPRYTWNHVFMASGWATRPHGPGGSGVVIPKNWRGQNEGGSPGY